MDDTVELAERIACRTSDAEDLFVTGPQAAGGPAFCRRLPGAHRVPRARARPAHRVRGLGRDDRAGAAGAAAPAARRRVVGRALGRRARRARRRARRRGRAAAAPHGMSRSAVGSSAGRGVVARAPRGSLVRTTIGVRVPPRGDGRRGEHGTAAERPALARPRSTGVRRPAAPRRATCRAAARARSARRRARSRDRRSGGVPNSATPGAWGGAISSPCWSGPPQGGRGGEVAADLPKAVQVADMGTTGTRVTGTAPWALVNRASSRSSRAARSTRSACSRSTAAASGAPRSPSAAARAWLAERSASTGCVRFSTSPASGISSVESRSTKYAASRSASGSGAATTRNAVPGERSSS